LTCNLLIEADRNMGSNTANGDIKPFVKVDPSGRWCELLGLGPMKKGYMAFDQEDGLVVN
ncbi:hypothetical protein ACH5RR_028727, partial [Cinchona calisaya]